LAQHLQLLTYKTMKTKPMKNQWNLFSKNALAAAILGVAALSSCSKDKNIADQSQALDNGAAATEQTVSDQYIVVLKKDQFNDGISGMDYDRQNALVEGRIQKYLNEKGINDVQLAPDNTFSAIELGFEAKLSDADVSKLENDPKIERIDHDAVLAMGWKTKGGTAPTSSTATTSTSQVSAYSYTLLTNTNSGTQVMDWGVAKVGGAMDGTGKTAWIVDSGIQLDHPDLNVDRNRSRSFLYSTDAATNYQSPGDEYGHGTFVAGIIGAKNNSYGTVGIASGCSLVSCRVMDKNGYCTVSKIVNALNYIAANGKPGDVVNISLGCSANTTVDNAVKNVAAKGIYVAIAAGNSHTDCSYTSPARVVATNVFTVSAYNSSNTFASYSNYGAPVKYSLPGDNIYSTRMGSSYGYGSGTSEAAPHMAGLLLATGGHIASSGTVIGDPDSWKDPMAHN
jgi:hypothetical protein